MITKLKLFSLVCALLVFVAGCDPLISPYSEQAYKNATELKAISLNLISKSGNSFNSHASEVSDLKTKVEIAYEYSKGHPKNGVIVQQWEILKSPEEFLLGGFLVKWERDGNINEFTREQSSEQIAAAFDTIICVEATKKNLSACGAQSGETTDDD